MAGKPEDRDPLGDIKNGKPDGYVRSVGKARRRRSDAKPGPKPDYHKSVALATRVPADLGDWVYAQAKAEGLSVSAWLRETLTRFRSEG